MDDKTWHTMRALRDAAKDARGATLTHPLQVKTIERTMDVILFLQSENDALASRIALLEKRAKVAP